ncbi:hypothetical protein CDV31_002053 [Fusarium ambrosium]|uniref:Uncharacterized protein n=1 Tax=Fusarium ambrosium TaxID=131363 RepID=A0A428UXZ2_9HYPO|nr:hypothetical protein CDV31_002053 [Fusarium ambrosium]
MDNELIIHLLEDPIEDGNFRTKNAAGERFRTLLVDRGNELVTKVGIVGITHGTLTGSDDPATLLVFEFRFVATGGRRFIRAKVTLLFEDSEGERSNDPEVLHILPEGKYALNKTERVWSTKWSANVGANGGVEATRGEVGLVWEREETKRREFFTSLSGMRRVIREDWVGPENAVVWTFEENRQQEDGIPTFARAAVLLKRVDDVPFSFNVKVNTDVDFIGKVKTLFGMERKDPIDPVEVDPARQPRAGQVCSLDPEKHDLTKLDKVLDEAVEVLVVTVLDGASLTGSD